VNTRYQWYVIKSKFSKSYGCYQMNIKKYLFHKKNIQQRLFSEVQNEATFK
jgi:hypothetical protein